MKLLSLALFLGAAPLVAADIPSTAMEAGTFNTLVAALGAADLVTALSDPNGPFTVFAPLDSSFDNLPGNLVSCLLKPENKDTLSAVLKYHVVEGEVLSTDLTDGMTATTLQGEDITFDLTDGVKINTAGILSATVATADIAASNGVIHSINGVLVPPSVDFSTFIASCTPTLLDIPSTAVAAGAFGTLVAALGAADLVDTLAGTGPFTVFAPTDDAFDALPEELVPCLLKPENKAALTAVLTYHVVSGKVLSTDLTDGMTAATVQGEEITVDLSDGVKINTVAVTTPDVEASNGVIHVMSGVLVPPSIDVKAFLDTCMATMSPTPSPTPVATTSSAAFTTPATILSALLFVVGAAMM